MTNSNYTLTVIYNNLYTYFNYKKLIPLDNKINDNDFIKHIYNNIFIIRTNLKLKFNTDSAGDASIVGMFDFLELGYIIAKVNHFL